MMIWHEQCVLSSLGPLSPTDIAVQAVPRGPADTMPTSAAQSLLPETIRLLGGNDRLRALASSPRLKLEWTGEREGGTYLALVKTRERWTQRDQPKHSAGEPFDAVLSRSEEHTSELQSLMRLSYAVFCLKKQQQ